MGNKLLSLGCMFVSILLIGCTKNADGVYIAYTKRGILTPSVKVILEVKGNQATLSAPGFMEPASMNANFRDGVLTLYKEGPEDAMMFNVINDGRQLQCNQCEQQKVPSLWDKQMM